MAEEKTVYGAKSTKLAQLLGIGTEYAQAADLRSDMQRKADLLCDLLAAKLPLYSSPGETFSCQGAGFPRTITSVLSESIEHHLLQKETTIATLERIKTHGAQLARTASSPVEHEPANVLYYGAIAGALVYHKRRITEFSLEELGTSFSRLSTLSWLTSPLSKLFEKATGTCRTLISQHLSYDQQ
jgi:hypothetical protein